MMCSLSVSYSERVMSPSPWRECRSASLAAPRRLATDNSTEKTEAASSTPPQGVSNTKDTTAAAIGPPTRIPTIAGVVPPSASGLSRSLRGVWFDRDALVGSERNSSTVQTMFGPRSSRSGRRGLLGVRCGGRSAATANDRRRHPRESSTPAAVEPPPRTAFISLHVASRCVCTSFLFRKCTHRSAGVKPQAS